MGLLMLFVLAALGGIVNAVLSAVNHNWDACIGWSLMTLFAVGKIMDVAAELKED